MMRGAKPAAALEESVVERVAALPGEVLVAAVSGGPDSVALAALLEVAARRSGARLVLGHVNHGVRDSAWQDEAVVLSVGTALHARVAVRALDPGQKSEGRLRAGRYRALAAIAREVGAVRVFAAHHAGDQTESVLLALFRGTGRNGLAGMPERRPLTRDVELHRPLLERTHGELVEYVAERRLPYAIDPTNADPAYARNAIRGALGALRDAFPQLDRAVARAAALAASERGQGARAKLRALVREEVLRTADVTDMSFERLDAAARAIEHGHQGQVYLGPGIHLNLTPVSRVSPAAASNEQNPESHTSPAGSQ